MALQLAPAGDAYGGGQQRSGRPQSSYYADGSQGWSSQQLATRNRSQSQSTQRQMTKDGRPIIHYCKFTRISVTRYPLTDLPSPARAMYMYQAAIPEELSFSKGDILAVLRLQDDGWWEAEVVGRNGGRPGLVPSNYLKNC